MLSTSHADCAFEGYFEEYDERRLDLIAKFIPNDPVIFEAGGFDGEDTVRFARLWPHSTIISFEANPLVFEKLLETTFGIPNIHCYNLAVNNFNGTAILHVCDANPGASSILEASPLIPFHYYYQGPKIKVPCVVLDDWCRENNIDHIDFMWLDIEGLEMQVLKSSPKILEGIKVIYTETNFQKFRKDMTQYQDLKNFLEASGFNLLAHWYIPNWQGDAIFVRKELLK